jgi:hypothetical protein
VTTRDPRSDPQPGDEVRNRDVIRRVLKREGERVLIQKWGQRYWASVESWKKWCEENGAEIARVTNQEG